MPTIIPEQVPTINPGSLFYSLTTNNSLAIRFLVSQDPHYFDTYNRPMADIALRQLILAKTIDQIGLRLSHQALFPFLVPPTVDVATAKISLPTSWLWDCHVSLNAKYTSLRLAQIERISGQNNPSDGTFTGRFKLIFTATVNDGAVETGIFTAQYEIDSSLTFQVVAISPCTETEFSPALPTSEVGSIAGYIIFRTLDHTIDAGFLTALAPPVGGTSLTDGTYAIPAVYDMTDTVMGGTAVTDDFELDAVAHGTGMLVSSAFCALPPVQTDEPSILSALNYPWKTGANLQSLDDKSTIPNNLFSIFDLVTPMGDRDTDDANPYPVYLTSIRRLDPAANSIELFFSTKNTVVGSTSAALIEFASLVLSRASFGTGGPGTAIRIYPTNNLIDTADLETVLKRQNFGTGFVVLNSTWANDTTITDLFDSLTPILDDPADRAFMAELGEFAMSRAPSTVPTIGQSQAMAGTSARRETPVSPSDLNRFVTEQDQGMGDQVDFTQLVPPFASNPDIEDVGYKGSLLARKFVLKVNTANDANFNYDTDILPRIRILLAGRDPIFGDVWYDGTVFKTFNGDTWIG